MVNKFNNVKLYRNDAASYRFIISFRFGKVLTAREKSKKYIEKYESLNKKVFNMYTMLLFQNIQTRFSSALF